MATRLLLVALGAGLFTGCATRSTPRPLSADHPANPDAMSAPASPPSTTLAIDEPVRSSPPAGMGGMQHGEMRPGAMQPGGMQSGGMRHGSGGMDHGAADADSAMRGMQDENHRGHGADARSTPSPAPQPATTQPSAGQALFACPMHPKVTSTNPNDRCPKCNMKINKPVKKAAMPTAGAVQPADGNAGHGSEHGGH